MVGRHRKDRVGRFSDGQETSKDQSRRTGRFSDGQSEFEDRADSAVGRFSTGQETIHEAEVDDAVRRVRNDHGLPPMSFRTAFARRKEVTSRASEQGLIEAANRAVFHDRGYTLTWDTKSGDLWLTPTENPDGWWYEEDVG